MDNNGSAEKQRGKSIVKRDIHIEKAVEADIDCMRMYVIIWKCTRIIPGGKRAFIRFARML